LNDYVYVENAAHAHICCLHALLNDPRSTVAGNAFCLSDKHQNIWDFLSIFAKRANVDIPTTRLPFLVLYVVACVIEFFCSIAYFCFGFHFEPTFTKYVVLAVCQDYYFREDKLVTATGYQKLYDFNTAIERTCDLMFHKNELLTPKCTSRSLDFVRFIHFLYGIFVLTLGFSLFFYPTDIFSFENLFCQWEDSQWNSSECFLIQTAGLIYSVLGIYSITAGYFFNLTYFSVTYPPRFITAIFYFIHIYLNYLPFDPFGYIALIEASVAFLTWVALPPKGPKSQSLRYDAVTVTQLLHALLSGIFAFIMSLNPSIILEIIFGDVSLMSISCIRWAYVMGNAEFFMTWTYTASALGSSLYSKKNH
jgi:hypothetical protein